MARSGFNQFPLQIPGGRHRKAFSDGCKGRGQWMSTALRLGLESPCFVFDVILALAGRSQHDTARIIRLLSNTLQWAIRGAIWAPLRITW